MSILNPETPRKRKYAFQRPFWSKRHLQVDERSVADLHSSSHTRRDTLSMHYCLINACWPLVTPPFPRSPSCTAFQSGQPVAVSIACVQC
jgi:hypothetical protein